MKGIPIKFRAKCIETGELITFELGEEIPQGIDTTTITQLVGYDKNGAEVYEGDTIINEYDYAVEFEKAIAKAGTRRACLAFETYIDWFDKPIRNFLTTEEQLKKRADYIKGFVKGGSDERYTD